MYLQFYLKSWLKLMKNSCISLLTIHIIWKLSIFIDYGATKSVAMYIYINVITNLSVFIILLDWGLSYWTWIWEVQEQVHTHPSLSSLTDGEWKAQDTKQWVKVICSLYSYTLIITFIYEYNLYIEWKQTNANGCWNFNYPV